MMPFISSLLVCLVKNLWKKESSSDIFHYSRWLGSFMGSNALRPLFLSATPTPRLNCLVNFSSDLGLRALKKTLQFFGETRT
jgi:hypothetical protein